MCVCRTNMLMQNIRCCDGCFNRGYFAVENARIASFIDGIKPISKFGSGASAATDSDNRKFLFANAKNVDDSQPERATQSAVSGATTSLSEASERLQERGERLGRLDEKTKKLAESSNEFANMAKELRKQQERKNRWW